MRNKNIEYPYSHFSKVVIGRWDFDTQKRTQHALGREEDYFDEFTSGITVEIFDSSERKQNN